MPFCLLRCRSAVHFGVHFGRGACPSENMVVACRGIAPSSTPYFRDSSDENSSQDCFRLRPPTCEISASRECFEEAKGCRFGAPCLSCLPPGGRVARRSRDGKEQAADGVAKRQRQSSFYIRRLPPYPPSRRGARKVPPLRPAIPEPPWLPIRASLGAWGNLALLRG